jgi:hypothetical protein
MIVFTRHPYLNGFYRPALMIPLLARREHAGAAKVMTPFSDPPDEARAVLCSGVHQGFDQDNQVTTRSGKHVIVALPRGFVTPSGPPGAELRSGRPP